MTTQRKTRPRRHARDRVVGADDARRRVDFITRDKIERAAMQAKSRRAKSNYRDAGAAFYRSSVVPQLARANYIDLTVDVETRALFFSRLRD
jgi:hypothetical protein